MNRLSLLMLCSLAALIGLIVTLTWSPSAPPPPVVSTSEERLPIEREDPLELLCAASNRPVIEAIKTDFEAAGHGTLQVQYGGSQTLLSGHLVAHSGDLFLPADDVYIQLAASKGLLSESFPVAQMRAIIAVQKGNPLQIRQLSDLLKPDVRLVQANPEVAAIGKLTRDALAKTKQWDLLNENTAAFKSTVIEVANDVRIGAADAGIVYDVVIHDSESLEAVLVPEFTSIVAKIDIGVLKSSKQPHRARAFADFLRDPSHGLKRYREFGFQVPEEK